MNWTTRKCRTLRKEVTLWRAARPLTHTATRFGSIPFEPWTLIEVAGKHVDLLALRSCPVNIHNLILLIALVFKYPVSISSWCVIAWLNFLKPTGYVMHQQFNISTIVSSAHTVFMCFVFIWEQTVTCAAYSINCLVFITEMKSVYCAVRTGSLNKAVCASSLKG